ncbi:MAG: hypothetical protein ABEJ56_03240 [Candidatus Nanohaloarchaea archaeon]
MNPDFDEEYRHQNVGAEYGQGFMLLEEVEGWSDNDALYEINVNQETVGYTRVTREVEWSFHQHCMPGEDNLQSALEETSTGDLNFRRANDLEEAPIINNGDQEIVSSGNSYLVETDEGTIGEAILAGEGERYQYWNDEANTGELDILDASDREIGRIVI